MIRNKYIYSHITGVQGAFVQNNNNNRNNKKSYCLNRLANVHTCTHVCVHVYELIEEELKWHDDKN